MPSMKDEMAKATGGMKEATSKAQAEAATGAHPPAVLPPPPPKQQGSIASPQASQGPGPVLMPSAPAATTDPTPASEISKPPSPLQPKVLANTRITTRWEPGEFERFTGLAAEDGLYMDEFLDKELKQHQRSLSKSLGPEPRRHRGAGARIQRNLACSPAFHAELQALADEKGVSLAAALRALVHATLNKPRRRLDPTES